PPRLGFRLRSQHLLVRFLEALRRHSLVVLAEVLLHPGRRAARVADRVDVDEPSELFRVLAGIGRDDQAREAVADQPEAADAERGHYSVEILGQAGDGVFARAVRLAVAAGVVSDGPPRGAEVRELRIPAARVRAQAVQEDDRDATAAA